MIKKRLGVIFVLLIFIITSFGCEAFRKKFIRKRKDKPEEEMVIYPKDYSEELLPSDQAYQQYYTYWKAWHQEILNFLNSAYNKKKIASCFNQAILNLGRMKKLLINEEKIEMLQGYIEELGDMDEEIQEKGFIMMQFGSYINKLELFYREIQRNFAFSKIEGDLKWQ